ncbi:hypothetical protein TOTORO_01010 [Serratia phage vB_SmaS-Totoro]|nr:hypothetical protein TOTORO_01010 [Serratia phage vB_SmaS-Totoro]
MTQSRYTSKDLTMEVFAHELDQGYLLEDIAAKYDIPFSDADRMHKLIRLTEYSARTGNAICFPLPAFAFPADESTPDLLRYTPRSPRMDSVNLNLTMDEILDYRCPGEIYRGKTK